MRRRDLWRWAVAVTLVAASVSAAPAASAKAKKHVLYAYPAGTSTATTCPKTSNVAAECDLTRALALVKPGGTVALARSGDETNRATFYVGNFTINTAGTSNKKPVTISPAKGVFNPIIDGNTGSATGCPTTACGGPVFTLGDGLHVKITSLTIQNGVNNTALGDGGAIDSADGPGTTGFLTVTHATFLSDHAANDGGAIDSGDNFGHGVLTVISSSFVAGSSSSFGGAIASALAAGTGTLRVIGSTFGSNSTASDGGAITIGLGGTGTVTTSTFTQNNSGNGGAISTFGSTLDIARSTFIGNAAAFGGAIKEEGSALSVDHSSFGGNQASASGGAIDTSGISFVLTHSTFAGNPGASGGISNDVLTGTMSIAANLFVTTSCTSVNAIDDGGYNVSDGSSCFNGGTGDVTNADAADLGPFSSNGGPTATTGPLATNPAVGHVPFNTTVTLNGAGVRLCPATDQRGVKSKRHRRCNAGAVDFVVP